MLLNTVKVYPSKINLPKKKQLAWKIAEIASDNVKLNNDAVEMSINRIIDNASVAIAAIFHASCLLFGRFIFDGYTLIVFNNKMSPNLWFCFNS